MQCTGSRCVDPALAPIGASTQFLLPPSFFSDTELGSLDAGSCSNWQPTEMLPNQNTDPNLSRSALKLEQIRAPNLRTPPPNQKQHQTSDALIAESCAEK